MITVTATCTKRRSPFHSSALVTRAASARGGPAGQAQVAQRPRLEREVTCLEVAVLAGRRELGLVDVARALLEARAARVEPARAGWIDRARHVALEHDRLACAGDVGVRDRDCGEQGARVRMLWMVVELAAGGHLDHLAQVHHG